MSFADIDDLAYRRALRKFEQACSLSDEDMALGYSPEKEEWEIIPHSEAKTVEGFQVVLVCKKVRVKDENTTKN
tara:strand:+ start:634 stop:855 length:222 start_codon:yes stop_codon:yes gene_type:complete